MPEPEAAPAQPPDVLQHGQGDTILLHDLTRWREQLARSIARNNLGMRSEPIATAVNRILFSLLFLCIAEDRGLIGAGTLRSIAEPFSTGHTMPALLRYSRGLYAGDPAAGHDDTEVFSDIVIDDRVLLAVLSSFSSAERHYNLAAMPTDTLAEILLRYLTRTVKRSAAHQAIIVDTHDTTQSGGTSAPPLPAIRYMVRSSLAAARAGRSRREILPLRVLDPACGTGSILLAAYQDLLDHHPGGVPGIEERREILTDSVYGLDISRHAVAVTRMLLFFQLAETGETRKLPGDFLRFSEKIFHDLRHSVRCGNALIGPEIINDESWMFCPARDRHTLLPFSWHDGFPEIFAAGGFDLVVSNPPEGVLEQREWIQQYFQRQYEVYHPSIDRSAYFLEKSLTLVNPGGSVSCIMNNRWLRGSGGSGLRELLNGRQIEEIVDFSGISDPGPGRGLCILRIRTVTPFHSFPATIAGPLFFENPDAFVSSCQFPVVQHLLDGGGWLLRDSRAEEIVRNVSLHSTSLEDFVMGEIHAGMPVSEDDPFIIDESTAREWMRRDPQCRPLLRRLVEGAEIRSSCAARTGKFFILIPQGWTSSHMKGVKQPWQWLKHRHPLIARHLQPFSESLKALAGPDELWWESGCDEFWQEVHKKILFPARFRNPVFRFDAGRGIGTDTTMGISSAGLYLQGILNSRLMAFVFEQSIRRVAPGRHWFSWEDLKRLPVYTPDFDRPEDHARHNRMEKMVQRKIDLEKGCRAAKGDHERERLREKIRVTDRQIDSLVYGLYGLTTDEIALVEEAVGR